MTKTHRYIFKNPEQVDIWLDDLLQSDDWHQEAPLYSQATFFDTFDWRLYRQQSSLQVTTEDSCQALHYRSLRGDLLASLSSSCQPAFTWDLPPGKLRQKLESLIKMRRLLPQVSVTSRQRQLSLLNNNGKIVLRLQLFSDVLVADPRGTKGKIKPHLQIDPVRGYPSAAQRLASRFDADEGLQVADNSPLAEALAAIGRQPTDYSSKLNLELKPSQSAKKALTTILLQLLATLKANLEGTSADLDSEFLHDFRVAVRRTRSALGQLKGILPAAELTPFREDFAWLGTITGPTRDLDVYLLKFNSYRNLLPKHQHQDLDPFHRFLVQHQKMEQKILAAELASPRFIGLLARWQALLERQRKIDARLATAKLPAKQVADQRICKLYKRCLKEGAAITAESPAEALHELRKACKKLRYLLEFFQTLYPAKAMKDLITALKVLQDNLGDFQDYQVHGEAMLSFGMLMAENQQAPPATLLAMGTLAGSLLHQQQQTREEFHHRFKSFCRPRNQQLFQKLFGSTGRMRAVGQ
ncbi:MAG: hypothetical protein BA870_02280 [Desulfuromonadales bacterium C00003094]|nr:MAG: hypothetical protein BA870_02280 [Desulfuromonadales bacterium C00003094]